MNLLIAKKSASFFACALAKEKKSRVRAGDPEFKALEKEIRINWLTGNDTS